jgi:hypothetical protein
MGRGRRVGYLAAAFLAGATGCGGSTNLTPVDYALTARSASGSSFTANGWDVTLIDARIGFGPLYLCASLSASPELCETAVAELAEVTTIDLMSADALEIGRIHGISDIVHTALFDYGITWRAGSAPLTAPQAPDGHALVLRGTAQSGATGVGFEILLDVAPQQPASYAVLARIPERRQSNATRLDLVFDPSAWLAGVDFAALAALGQPVVTVRLGDPAGSVVATALTSTARPTFNWIDVP